MTAIAAFAATSVNAQNNEQIVNRLVEKAEPYWASEGPKASAQDVTSLAAQHTYYYDNQVLEAKRAFDRDNNRRDSLIIRMKEAIRRNATSGVGVGFKLGCIQMAENFSPTFGLMGSMAWKRVEAVGGFSLAISKYNSESSKAGSSFFCPIANADLGYIVSRFPLGGYNNRGYISLGYSFMYIFDKNQNVSGQNTYETATESITTTDYFSVEGNSMAHTAYVKARFGLKEMGVSSISFKLYGGLYNRYYQEGSRRKAVVGAEVSLEFSGAKKRVDKDVETLEKSLRDGDYTLINDVTNKILAEKMK